MKKTILLALSLAAPIFAGDAPMAPAPIITPQAPAPACCPLTLDVAGIYNYGHKDLFAEDNVKDIDTYGIDFTVNYALAERHSVNLRLGYTFGDEAIWYGDARNETDVHTFYLMPGYRYTHPLTEKLAAYAGVNAGLVNVSVKDHWRDGDGSAAAHDSEFGLGCSAEIGLSYDIAENWELFAAYQFSGSTATPAPDQRDTRKQLYSGIRAGVSYKF